MTTQRALVQTITRRVALGLVCVLLVSAALIGCGSADTGDTEPPPVTRTRAPALNTAADQTLAAARGTDLDDAGFSEDRPGSAPPRQDDPTPAPLRVRVWWPDELYPAAGSSAEDILIAQIEGFQQTYTTFTLEVRRKRATGLGGILPTLRTAQPVAPGALPDLALMRRADMLTAANEDLIQPLDDWAPSDLVNENLLAGARALGEIDGVLYGIPYALNITHSVYRASVFDMPLLTFSDVLAADPVYHFPAANGMGSLVNWTTLLQYLAAGGTLVDADGRPTLDAEPLRLVLTYYEQGVERDIFSPALLEQSDFSGYWNEFAAGEANMIGVDAVTYLQRKDGVPNVGLASVPTVNGDAISALDGWMWVLTTQDPDQQRQARAFLSWMMRISQHSLLSEALGVLPSQDRALRLWDDEAYADFAHDLLPDARIVPISQRNNSAAIALQESLIAVLEGTPADTAVDDAILKLLE